MGVLFNKIEKDQLKPGDHIYSYRVAYLYAHHGILSSFYYSVEAFFIYYFPQTRHFSVMKRPLTSCYS